MICIDSCFVYFNILRSYYNNNHDTVELSIVLEIMVNFKVMFLVVCFKNTDI